MHSNINVKIFKILYIHLKNYGEYKMKLMNSEFNNIQNEWFNSCANINRSKDAKKNH
jgi:hypothetical protein